MRKIIFFIISFLFIFNSIASACNFRISNFGDPKEKIKLEPMLPVSMPDRFGGESLIIPMEDLCKNDDKLYGTTVIYLYIENINLSIIYPIKFLFFSVAFFKSSLLYDFSLISCLCRLIK